MSSSRCSKAETLACPLLPLAALWKSRSRLDQLRISSYMRRLCEEVTPRQAGLPGRRVVAIRPAPRFGSVRGARPGTDPAIFRSRPGRPACPPGISDGKPSRENVDAATRNPMLLFLLSGLFLSRAPQPTLSRLSLNEPPRNTRRLRVRTEWFFTTSVRCNKGWVDQSGRVDDRQPPSKRPVSETMAETCSYWPSESHPSRAAKRR